jgi:hypothetical protein
MNASNDDNRDMDAHSIDLFAALLLTALCVLRILHVMRHRPWVSMANARSLVFAGGLLASMIYFWSQLFKTTSL